MLVVHVRQWYTCNTSLYTCDRDLVNCGCYLGTSISASVTALRTKKGKPDLAHYACTRIRYKGSNLRQLRLLPLAPQPQHLQCFVQKGNESTVVEHTHRCKCHALLAKLHKSVLGTFPATNSASYIVILADFCDISMYGAFKIDGPK